MKRGKQMQDSGLYNRMFSLEILSPIIGKQETLFIYGKTAWKKKNQLEKSRGDICKEVLQPKQSIQLEYMCEGVDNQKLIDDTFKVWYGNGSVDEYDSLDDVEIRRFLMKLNKVYKYLIVDITLINIRLLGAILALVSEFEWDGIYCCYTEPGEYIQKKEDDERKFDLKTVTLGFDEIPNLQTMWDGLGECEWIIFMGFEGSRLQMLQLEAEPGRKYTVPVALIPSMHVEWYNYVIEANLEFMETIGKLEGIKYVSAVNPFEVFNFLEKERNENKSNNLKLKISPVGTKLTALGSIMYVIKYSDDMLLTDNPIQEEENSLSYGKSYGYDLTFFFKSVKNIRFQEEVV